jgi:hypothetical protein
MPSPRLKTLNARLRRQLASYKPSDGPTIDVRVMPDSFNISHATWLTRLVGEGAYAPLLGRIYQGNRPVILASSFVEWVAAQNPHLTREQCQALTDDLVAATERLREYWRQVTEGNRLAGKLERPGLKPQPKEPKKEGWKAPISNDAFKAWG